MLVLVICQLVSSEEKARQQKATQVSDDTLERAIKDSRYFNRQFACLVGEGPCDHVGRKLKGETKKN